MTLAPDVQSLIDWSSGFDETHASLPVPELRDATRDELDHDRLELAGVETTRHRRLAHTHCSSVLWQTWEPAREWMEDVVGALRGALREPEVASQ